MAKSCDEKARVEKAVAGGETHPAGSPESIVEEKSATPELGQTGAASLVSKYLKIFIIMGEMLEDRLEMNRYDCEEIKGVVMDRILEICEVTMSWFKEKVLRNSRVIFVYTDEATAVCLRNVMLSLKLASGRWCGSSA